MLVQRQRRPYCGLTKVDFCIKIQATKMKLWRLFESFHALISLLWLAHEHSIVTMGRQIANMFIHFPFEILCFSCIFMCTRAPRFKQRAIFFRRKSCIISGCLAKSYHNRIHNISIEISQINV